MYSTVLLIILCVLLVALIYQLINYQLFGYNPITMGNYLGSTNLDYSSAAYTSKVGGEDNYDILFVTGNKNKKAEAEQILGVTLDNKSIDLPEIQSLEVQEVTERKVKDAYEHENKKLFVEDTGLYIKEILINGELTEITKPFPGALIRSYYEALGLDHIAKIHGGAKAYAETIIGYHDGEDIHYFAGRVNGTIAVSPRGENGFGWDKIFIPDGFEMTYAEMTAEQKNNNSMRNLAFMKFAQHLKQ